MRVESEKVLVLQSEDEDTLTVRYDNRGDPYREGVTLDFCSGDIATGVFLDKSETFALRDLLNTLYPPAKD